MVSVRTSGQLVLDELLRNADGAAGILAGAVRRRMDEAARAKVLAAWRGHATLHVPHRQKATVWQLMPNVD